MFSFLASLLTGATSLVSDARCTWIWMDEAKCPKSLIK